MIENGPKIINPKGSTNNYSTVSPGISATLYSETWDLVDLDVFALEYQAACTGTPSVKLKLQQSSNNTDWYIPDNIADINPSLTDKNLHGIKLPPIPVRYLRISVENLSGSIDDLVVTLKVSAQKRYSA